MGQGKWRPVVGTLTSGRGTALARLNSCAAVVSCTGSPPNQAFQHSAVEWVGVHEDLGR